MNFVILVEGNISFNKESVSDKASFILSVSIPFSYLIAASVFSANFLSVFLIKLASKFAISMIISLVHLSLSTLSYVFIS